MAGWKQRIEEVEEAALVAAAELRFRLDAGRAGSGPELTGSAADAAEAWRDAKEIGGAARVAEAEAVAVVVVLNRRAYQDETLGVVEERVHRICETCRCPQETGDGANMKRNLNV